MPTSAPPHLASNPIKTSAPQHPHHPAYQPTSDRVTLSAEALARAKNEDPDAWRTAPREYPEGFPEDAKALLEKYASDPSISVREFGMLELELVALPQIEAHARGFVKSPHFSMDTDVFTHPEFNFTAHVESLIKRNEDIISKGDNMELRSRQNELLKGFL